MKKNILLPTLFFFLFQFCIVSLYAVKAYQNPIIITQPDGTQLTIRLQGDEYHHFQTTEDGYLLKTNSKGFLTYAKVSATGEIVESSMVAQDAGKRSTAEIQFLKTMDKSVSIQVLQKAPQKSRMLANGVNQPRKAYPLNGFPKALVILANFKDKSFVTSTPQIAFQNLLTLDGYSSNGGTGSARDYFMSSTYGKFAPNFIVVGPVTLPQTLDYYGKNDANGNDTNPAQMIVDACAAADAAGLDFTQFDTDNDGFVDNVFVYYAGYNEAEGGPANTIWPHRWSISSAGITTGITLDGKKIEDYSCTSELKGNTGANMCGIGTFCHEFGHVLGLPDYYDTSGTQRNTLNTWDIMDYGAYSNGGNTPPAYSVYDRFFLGYLIPEQINTPSDKILLPLYQGKTTVANTIGQTYLFAQTTHNLNGASPNPSEFFMVEYRKKTGWDTYLPAEGMCIWHIDFDQTSWNNNDPNNYTGSTQSAASHMRVYLQPLIGQTTTPGTAFTTGSFTPITWSGTDINRGISNITTTAANITFKFMASRVTNSGSFVPFTTTLGASSAIQSTTVTGFNLTSNVNVALQDTTNYDIKLSTDVLWSKALSIAPTSGSVNASIQVRLNPKEIGTLTDQLAISCTGITTTNLNLTGTSSIGPNSPQIIVGKVDNSISFGMTKLSISNSKTINVKTTDINNNLGFAITGSDASMFSVSVGSVTKDAANAVAGTNITVTFIPTSTGAHSATLTISGGGLSPDRVITLSGTGI